MQLQTLKSENRVQGSGLVLDWSQEKVTAVKEAVFLCLDPSSRKEFAGNFGRYEVRPPHESTPTRGCGGAENGGRWLGHVCGSDSWATRLLSWYRQKSLAEQHFESLKSLFPDLKLALLMRFLESCRKKRSLGDHCQG